MQKIMIIEDDTVIRDELALVLLNEGYQVSPVTCFAGIPDQIRIAGPDLILLDLGLPDQDGFTLCADIRRISAAPVIFVTSRNSAMDELKALTMGGDDYITKPYNIPVLLAHIKAVLRRGGSMPEADAMEFNGLRLSLVKGTISAGGNTVELTRNELRILAFLMEHSGEIVSRVDLIEALWNSRIYIDDNTLSVNVTRLRTKLEELGLPGYIKTRRGLGYQI